VTGQQPDSAALAYEAAVNRSYLNALLKKFPLQRPIPNPSARVIRSLGEVVATLGGEALIGRLELDHVDEDIGRTDFYVGPTTFRSDDLSVVSWVAPFAGLFFMGTSDLHDLAAHVTVRRTLVSRRDEIEDIVDDWVVTPTSPAFSSGSIEMQVPAPPTARKRTNRPVSASGAGVAAEAQAETRTAGRAAAAERAQAEKAAKAKAKSEAAARDKARAAAAVKAAAKAKAQAAARAKARAATAAKIRAKAKIKAADARVKAEARVQARAQVAAEKLAAASARTLAAARAKAEAQLEAQELARAQRAVAAQIAAEAKQRTDRAAVARTRAEARTRLAMVEAAAQLQADTEAAATAQRLASADAAARIEAEAVAQALAEAAATARADAEQAARERARADEQLAAAQAQALVLAEEDRAAAVQAQAVARSRAAARAQAEAEASALARSKADAAKASVVKADAEAAAQRAAAQRQIQVEAASRIEAEAAASAHVAAEAEAAAAAHAEAEVEAQARAQTQAEADTAVAASNAATRRLEVEAEVAAEAETQLKAALAQAEAVATAAREVQAQADAQAQAEFEAAMAMATRTEAAAQARADVEAASVQAVFERAAAAAAEAAMLAAVEAKAVVVRSAAPKRSGPRTAATPTTEPTGHVGMRALEAVLTSLRAPRQERMSSVLATLQPDQYDLVSRPPGEPLVIQGHPGTGKTVIAAHRAAFLVHEESGSGAISRVLLLGPTDTFVRHVEGLVRSLDPHQRVVVRGLEDWLKEMAGISGEVFRTAHGERLDTSWQTGGLFARAVKKAREKAQISANSGPAVAEQVWNMVRANRVAGQILSTDQEVRAWAAALPPYREAVKERRYLPLIANLALSLRGVTAAEKFPHVIVDEAQDLRPLEWLTVAAFNSADCWTIVGDIHQRHSDQTYSSWTDMATDLDLADDAGNFEPVIFERGYRSTEAILNFANRLLPKGERAVTCLQTGGPAPTVRLVEAKLLAKATIELAEEFLNRHPRGSTAIITTTPFSVFGVLRSTGWHRVTVGRDLWERDEQQISVMVPELARGLEFDAVVVQEPSGFPENHGRRGPLYTSLTRANRELGVVHARPLPVGLRATTAR
jgi:hypothetical protein